MCLCLRMFRFLHMSVGACSCIFILYQDNCLCMQMCVCVWSGGCGCQSGGVCVCVWILYAHKKKRSWDESGAAHVETLSAETVSMRSIMRQGWALMWLLSSPPIGSSLCVYVYIRVHVHELVSREGAAPSHPSFLSSLYPLKNTPKTTNWLWWASCWAHSFRRTGGPPPPQLPTVSSQWFGQLWRSYHKSPGVFCVTMSTARGQWVAGKKRKGGCVVFMWMEDLLTPHCPCQIAYEDN